MVGWEDICGAFDYQALYDEMVAEATDGARFVEVGCWLGRSTIYLAKQIQQARKRIELYAVDHGLGSPPNSPDWPVYEPILRQLGGTFAGQLARNILACDVQEVVTQIVAPSQRASRLFANESLDFAFIDADHGYESVIRDLESWWPKIRAGGLLAGHDYTHWPSVARAVDAFFERKLGGWPTCPSCWGVRRTLA